VVYIFGMVYKAVKHIANVRVNQNVKWTDGLRGAIQRINAAWLEITQVRYASLRIRFCLKCFMEVMDRRQCSIQIGGANLKKM
jgi:hypothetical protein